jgi:diketogulonate reductase-like aldo/keto reductase
MGLGVWSWGDRLFWQYRYGYPDDDSEILCLSYRFTPLIALLEEIGKRHDGKDSAQVGLEWEICMGGLPIHAAKTGKQAGQNVGALAWRLTPDEIRALDMGSEKVI